MIFCEIYEKHDLCFVLVKFTPLILCRKARAKNLYSLRKRMYGQEQFFLYGKKEFWAYDERESSFLESLHADRKRCHALRRSSHPCCSYSERPFWCRKYCQQPSQPSSRLTIGVTLIAFGAILHGLRTARWFLLHSKAGPIIICIIRVLKDVIYVFLIWMIVYLSFALGI